MDETREQLADYAHQAWSGWMRYLFDKSVYATGGTIIIPAWAAQRWARQAATPYAELPEAEKESDRAEADKILAIVRQPDALALATASLLDQAAGVAELLQEAGGYIAELLIYAPLAASDRERYGPEIVGKINRALGTAITVPHEASDDPDRAYLPCPDCGAPLLRRAGQSPLCPNDLCNYVAARIARGEHEHDRNSSAVSRGAQAGAGAGDRGWPDR